MKVIALAWSDRDLMDGAGGTITRSPAATPLAEAAPEDVLAELVQLTRNRLGTFADGSPLPESFKVEHVVEPVIAADGHLPRSGWSPVRR
jgi:hypothetical protein